SHRALLALWVEGYARSLVGEPGPWADFGRDTVRDWLELLAARQPAARRDTKAGEDERTLLLAVLRGALLDLLATGDTGRVTRAVERQLNDLDRQGGPRRGTRSVLCDWPGGGLRRRDGRPAAGARSARGAVDGRCAAGTPGSCQGRCLGWGSRSRRPAAGRPCGAAHLSRPLACPAPSGGRGAGSVRGS